MPGYSSFFSFQLRVSAITTHGAGRFRLDPLYVARLVFNEMRSCPADSGSSSSQRHNQCRLTHTAPPHRRPVAVWNEAESSRLGGSRCAGPLGAAFQKPRVFSFLPHSPHLTRQGRAALFSFFIPILFYSRFVTTLFTKL
jgi:hypothetical protein